jgi:FkbM family methyltransferase
MAKKRNWFGELLLHAPKPIRSLRNVPALGGLIHYFSHRILPANERVRAQVQSGPAEGLRLELNPRTGAPYLRGEVEAATQKVLVQWLRPGMIFYDLGANIGFFSLLAARLVGASGRVFSFEPDAEVAARLRRNIALNEFSTITVVEAGVWSSNANVRFIPADASSPDRGTGKFPVDRNLTSGTEVHCVALDEFIRTAPAPDAIKCDVEGAELEALRGAKGLLETRRPWILCELHSEANDRMARDFLRNLGYEIETVDSIHILARPITES